MSEQIRVLLLDPDGRDAAGLRQARRLTVHRCHDVADLQGRVAAGAGDVAVIAPGSAGLDALVVARLRAHGCRVVAAAAGAADSALAGRIGITEHLASPLDAEALLHLVQAPAAAQETAGRDGGGAVIAVWGPPGAPGRTTVSALLAVGARRAGARVVVVDADLATGGWTMLSTASSGGSGLLTGLRRAAAGGADVDDLLVPQAEGIDLLPHVPDPRRWVEAAPAAMPLLLGALCRRADVVVVDVGADIRPAHPAYDIGWAHDSAALARSTVQQADTVAAVLSAEPVGVHRFAAWWPVLSGLAASPAVVANRVGTARAGRRPQQQLAAVLDSLGVPGGRVDVPWDARAAEGVSAAGWTAAKGWRDAPQRLWSALGRSPVSNAA